MASPKVNDLYAQDFDFLPARRKMPKSRIVIATIPRTGSTHLGIELWRTGVFGAPLEYITMENRIYDMYPRIGRGDPREYWKGVMSLRSSPNGIFAFKAFASDIRSLQEKYPLLYQQVQWDGMIFLRRRDKLAQAISYARARQTSSWFSGQANLREPNYDPDLIKKALSWIEASEQTWGEIACRSVTPIIDVYYEDIIADVTHVTADIIRKFEIAGFGPRISGLPKTEIQRDAINEDWRNRYMDTFCPTI